MTLVDKQVTVLPDGRQLGYATVGKGAPILYFHGTASSRLEVLLLKNLAETADLQLIAIDRPGYGLSSFKSRKNLAGVNDDINFLMDHLDVERFGVLGWSGGGVFALSYLASNPLRVNCAVVAATPSLPFDVSTAHNMPLARYIMKLPYVGVLAMREMRREVLRADGDVEAFMASRQGKQMLQGASRDDLRFFSDSAWMGLMYQSMAEAFRQGEGGVRAVVEEHQIFTRPWSFSLDSVPAGRLHVWHGAEDLTCRIENAYALCRAVGDGCVLEVFEGRGHCVLFAELERLGELLG